MTAPSASSTRAERLRRRVRRGRGRPKKFGRPSRAVSVTLPDDVIERLAAIDGDLGRAIVGLLERHPAPAGIAPAHSAEVSSYGTHAVIVVPPVRKLGKLAGVELIPIGGNRALIALDGAQRVPQFELAVRDVLDHGAITVAERRTLHGIADILQQARLSRTVAIAERTIIVLQATADRTSGSDARHSMSGAPLDKRTRAAGPARRPPR